MLPPQPSYPALLFHPSQAHPPGTDAGVADVSHATNPVAVVEEDAAKTTHLLCYIFTLVNKDFWLVNKLFCKNKRYAGKLDKNNLSA